MKKEKDKKLSLQADINLDKVGQLSVSQKKSGKDGFLASGLSPTPTPDDFSSLFWQSPYPMVYKKDGVYTECNKAFCDFVGKGKNQIIGYTAKDFFPDYIAQQLMQHDNHIINSRTHGYKSFTFNLPLNYPVKQSKHIIHRAPVIDDSSNILGVVATIYPDHDEATRLRDSLKSSEYFIHSALKMMPDGFIFRNQNGEYSRLNSAFEQLTGIDQQSLLSPLATEFLDGLYAEVEHAAALMDFSNEGQVNNIVTTEIHSPFRPHPQLVQISWAHDFDDTGKPAGVMLLLRDISHQRQSYEALLKGNDLFRNLIQSLPDPTFYKDCKLRYIGCNHAFEQLTGFSQNQIIGKKADDFLHLDFISEHEEYDSLVIEKGHELTCTKELIFNNIVKFYEIRKVPVLDIAKRIIGVFTFIRDISLLKQRERLLQENSILLESTIDANPDIIVFKDQLNRIISCNQAYARLLGMDKKDIVGKTASGLLIDNHPAGSIIFDDSLDALPAHSKKSGREVKISIKGKERFFEVLSAAVPGENNSVRGLLNVAREITERKNAEIALRQAQRNSIRSHSKVSAALLQVKEYVRQAEAASKSKSEFPSNMNHEKNPLNGVLGMTDLLLDTKINPQKRYAEMAKNSGKSLLSLVNDILDFSKIESGCIELENTDFSMQKVLEEVADIVSYDIQAKNIDLVYYLEHDIPEMVRGDLGRIRQVLLNLVGNAVKFTDSGAIEIKVSLKEKNNDFYIFLLEVKDTGIGIPADKVGSLFDAFTQVGAPTTKKLGGSGLGLSICKRLVELMGGEIGVESELKHGSKFWFTLRLTKSEEKNQDCFPS